MGNKILIPLIYCSVLKVRAIRIDCRDITPYILGADNCQTEIYDSDIDYSQENIVMGGSSGDPEMVTTS